eukprot:6844306-Prymnesium_polylepis.1
MPKRWPHHARREGGGRERGHHPLDRDADEPGSVVRPALPVGLAVGEAEVRGEIARHADAARDDDGFNDALLPPQKDDDARDSAHDQHHRERRKCRDEHVGRHPEQHGGGDANRDEDRLARRVGQGGLQRPPRSSGGASSSKASLHALNASYAPCAFEYVSEYEILLVMPATTASWSGGERVCASPRHDGGTGHVKGAVHVKGPQAHAQQ